MPNTILIQQLSPAEITRIAEIDRAEQITLHYGLKDGVLQAETVDWQCPAWTPEGDGPHSVAENINTWRPVVEGGGILLGAFDDDRLAGLAILRPNLTDSMAQLAFLHVSRAYRRQGVGEKLVAEVVRLAKAAGAQQLYVSATATGSAVGFYTAQGFTLTPHPHPELLALEPEDIHMIKPLT